MRLLLDTHLLLWAAAESRRLTRDVRELLEDTDNDVFYSAASIWEIAIKVGLRRKDFRIDLVTLVQALPDVGFIELPVTGAHAVAVTELPPLHRDPFDRLLVAQSITEPLTLLTNDPVFRRYSTNVRVV